MSKSLWSNLTLQSKLMSLILLTALALTLLTGYIAYSNSKQALTDSAVNQMASLRTAKASEIESRYNFIQQHVLTLSEASMTIDALKAFQPVFAKLNSQALSPAQQAKLTAFYEKDYLPILAKRTDTQPSLAAFLPQDLAGQYLQYHYIAQNPDRQNPSKLDDAKDGSEYSKIHAKYHSRFRTVAERMGYEDLMIFDREGNMIYSVAKQPDFATNMRSGSYSQSTLANAYQDVIRSGDPEFVKSYDFSLYRANAGLPAGFIATTVFDYDGEFLGALIFQIQIDRLNQVMTSNQQWEQVGLGKTGETFLVGQDRTLRSLPRLFVENPEEYYKTLENQKVPPEVIDKIRRLGTPILVQSNTTEAALEALANNTGSASYEDYRGEQVLGAYQPVKLGDSRWALIAKMDEKEAFQGLNRLTQRLLLGAAILIPLLTLLSTYFARLFLRPINRLISGNRQVAAGDTDVNVPVTSEDEMGELTTSFNDMTQSLRQKDEKIQAQMTENNRLLLNILPAPVAEQMKQGREQIADTFPNVTVIYVEIEGFSDLTLSLPADSAVSYLNELVGAFDEVAEQYGVEKIKTIGSAYLAVCGLSVPRIDHTKRTMDFAIEMLKIVRTFNQSHHSGLALDIGIHSGPVVAGVVGKSKFIYELWGETLNIARAIHASPDENIIQVSEIVYSALSGMYAFQPSTPVMVKGKGAVSVWSIKPLSPESESARSEAEVDNARIANSTIATL